jgi:outer membrane protein assembly factor BamB
MPPRKRLPGYLFKLILLVIVTAGLITLFYRLYDNYRPVITSIPILKPDSRLVILGQGFGAQQGNSQLKLTNGQVLAVSAWSDTRLESSLPVGLQNGSVIVERTTWLGLRPSTPHDFITQAAGLPSQPYGYQAPVQEDSPWPTFRRDTRNSAYSPIKASYQGDKPWTFRTGKGIFSSPIIDAQGVIYVGSADHYFYALNPDGSLKWKYETGEIIDSSGALGRYDPVKQYQPLTFVSGDGKLYHFRADGDMPVEARKQWVFEAEIRPEASYNRWFEGNVAISPDGTFYAGNTNFLYYAITPDGQRKWTYPTTSNNWSMTAFGEDGTMYWGSNDTYIRAVSPSGKELWRSMTLGFIAASAAVGTDGTVYIGSFDSNLYALNPLDGQVKWKFPTNDHIYASAALGQDSQGQTNSIYIASADGSVYALDVQGKQRWRYDTGDAIRSSVSVGLDEKGQEVLYFGCGNGKLYALNGADGSLRWAYDTTPDDVELRDRNDLNASPALGKTGLVIGGEHGDVVYMPYDYCLKQSDPRCTTHSNELPSDAISLLYVTPGGNTLTSFPQELPVSTFITLRLSVRQKGQTVNAFVCNSPLGCPADAVQVSFEPSLPFTVDHSADGRYLYIRPSGFFQPGAAYKLAVKGRYYSGGYRLGNLTLGGSESGRFEGQFNFQTAPAGAVQPSLQVGTDKTSALEWTRLAAPLPPMLPSLNQIGFDYMDWLLGTVAFTPPDAQNHGRVIFWAVGARKDPQGRLVADPASDFTLPLSGEYQNDSLVFANQAFKMPITGINIPFNRFELRGQLGKDGIMQSPSAFADTEVLSIPTFGPYLMVAGLANNVYQKMLVAGTYVTRPYEGPANLAPQGVSLEEMTFTAPQSGKAGQVQARFKTSASIQPSEHRLGLLLVDPNKMEAIGLDYRGSLKSSAADTAAPNVSLEIPANTKLPAKVRVYVLWDVYPLTSEEFNTR